MKKRTKEQKKILAYRLTLFIIGILIESIGFNLFFIPNNFVSSGLTGVAVILSKYSSIETWQVLFWGNLMFIGLSITVLGMEKTYKLMIGAIAFTLAVFLTQDINQIINIQFDDVLLSVIAAGVLVGIGEGFVLKTGFSSGGTSILAVILAKYLKKPLGSVLRCIGAIIVIMGGFTFGYTTIMYSILIIFISSTLIDKVILGTSDSKMLIISTRKEYADDIRKILIKKIQSGVTTLEGYGGYAKKEREVLLCIIPTYQYELVKSKIKRINPHAFITVSDCYEVLGGTKKNKIPFHNYVE